MREKMLYLITPAAGALPLLFSGCTHRPYDRPMGRWDHMMGPYGYGGMFMWLILIVLVAVIIYFVIERSRGNGAGGGATDETPVEILKKRYAKGEITKEEFERMKNEIEP